MKYIIRVDRASVLSRASHLLWALVYSSVCVAWALGHFAARLLVAFRSPFLFFSSSSSLKDPLLFLAASLIPIHPWRAASAGAGLEPADCAPAGALVLPLRSPYMRSSVQLPRLLLYQLRAPRAKKNARPAWRGSTPAWKPYRRCTDSGSADGAGG